MPMLTLPTPLAALAYTAVKVVGYAEFARVFNKIVRLEVSPYKFGAVKTAFGLMGSVVYFIIVLLLSVLLSVFETNGPATFTLFLGAIPLRFLVWAFVLDRYYSSRMTPRLLGSPHTSVADLGVILAGIW